MANGSVRFEGFCLDPEDRQLTHGGARVELNARYFDALILLVSEQGRLVSKDRFLDEVWSGVPVTDEALTQCIRTLRRQLGDDAANPRFIETVPKHGYRFVARVEPIDGEAEAGMPMPTAGQPASVALPPQRWRQFLLIATAATLGGGAAGAIGGLFYGFAGAAQPLQPGVGAISVLLVLVSVTIATALVGGAGVGLGVAAGYRIRGFGAWSVAGGAFGGLVVGACAKLLGLDAFNLLVGQSPGDITGAAEGALLGGAVGLGAWLGSFGGGAPSLRRATAAAALAGGAAGMVISLLGGRLMGGSLDLLARSLPGSRLRLDQVGAMFGESGFGPATQLVTAILEGALFGGCVVGAMIVAARRFGSEGR